MHYAISKGVTPVKYVWLQAGNSRTERKNPDVLLEEHVTPEWDRIYVSVIYLFL